MATKGKVGTTKREEAPRKRRDPRCLPIAEKGITDSKQFASFMSAMMSDLISNVVTPQVGNAVCNAGGKLLKIVEMEMKYGKQAVGSGGKTLQLTQ